MEFNNTKKSFKVIDIAYIGIMAAIIYIATLMQVKTPGDGVLHPGDSMAFLAAILLGGRRGALAAAIGMGLSDFVAVPFWAPYTFVIKGVMVLIVGMIAYRSKFNGKNIKNNVMAFILGGLWMIVAYLISGIFISIVYNGMTLPAAEAYNLAAVPFNILQVVIGIAIALPIIEGLKNTKFINK